MNAKKMRRPKEATNDSGSINLDELRYLLTIRYYPKGLHILPKLTWKDFIPYSGLETVVKPLIEGTIKSAIDTEKPKTVGIAISGGVDSTTILALTRKLYPKLDIKSVCITFGEDKSESVDAQNAAEMFDTNHFHLNIENPIQELPKQISVLRVPRWNTYTYYIFDYFARNKVDMLLTGDGGDEMFGGYAFRYKEILNSNTLDSKAYLDSHKMDWVPDQPKLFGRRISFQWEEIYLALSEYFSNPLDKLGQTFLADYNGKLLYDFAPTNTCFAEHFNENMVAPFLNKEVIYTISHLPYRFKYDDRNNVGKIILRQILLENFAYRSAVKGKVGFGMNRDEMWRKTRNSAIAMFEEAQCVEMGLINKAWLDRAVEKANSKMSETKLRYVTKLFSILALEVLLRLFVTKEIRATDKL